MKNKYFVFSSEISRSSGGIGNTTYYLIKSFVEYNCPTIGIVDRSPDLVSGATIYETKEKSILKRIIKGLIFYRHNNGNEGISLCLSWRYAIVPFLCGGKYIVMTHGNDVENVYRSSFRIRVENRLRNTILNHAAKICANSMYTASLVKQIRIKDEPIIIHPCSGEIVDYYEKASDGKYILSIGRLEERKGFQFVIEAFRKISNIYNEYKYIIAGDGPYRHDLEKLITQYKLEKKCILKGRISEDEKAKLLRNCTVLIMPSFYNKSVGSVEGFGIVFIEANAHGKPVIGSRSGGIPDAIQDGKTGLLVDEKNVEQLEEAIQSVLSGKIHFDDQYCKNWAEKHYYTEIAKQYLETIKLLIQNEN